jgi:hypothetical protein
MPKGSTTGGKDHQCSREYVTLFNRLVAKMLEHDPDCRISATNALDDPWFKMPIFDFGLLFPLNPTENLYVPGMMTPRIIMDFIEGPLFWLLRYRNPTEEFHENDIKRAVIEKLLDVDLSVIRAAIVAANEAETDEQKLSAFLQNRSARHLMEYVADEVFTGKSLPRIKLLEIITSYMSATLIKGPISWIFRCLKRKDFNEEAIEAAINNRLWYMPLSSVSNAIELASRHSKDDKKKLKIFLRDDSAFYLLEDIIKKWLPDNNKFTDLGEQYHELVAWAIFHETL